MSITTHINREFDMVNGTTAEREITIDVEYRYHRARRGARDRFGAPLEPDEDEDVEIVSVTDSDSGVEVELTKGEEERIKEEIIEHIEDSAFTD